jgi:hypothetical protein
MTNNLTMPALFSVLVGDSPERRVATLDTRDEIGDWWTRDKIGGEWEWQSRSEVHDVNTFILDGTPVDRIVVLPDVGEVTVDAEDDGFLWCGGIVSSSPANAHSMLRHAAHTLACWVALDAADQARAAEPARSPDPLAQARKDLLSRASMAEEEGDRYVKVKPSIIRALLATTEGGGEA